MFLWCEYETVAPFFYSNASARYASCKTHIILLARGRGKKRNKPEKIKQKKKGNA